MVDCQVITISAHPVIVQEFIAGHASLSMTHRYLKMQPWHVREKIIEAFVNGDLKTAMDMFADKIAKGKVKPQEIFVSANRFREHIQDLPDDFVSFASVDGGICIMGGKGDACESGGVYEEVKERSDTVEFVYGPVRGGCGNCRYFRTAPFLIQEQAFYLDLLMFELREIAKHRKELRIKIRDFKRKTREASNEEERFGFISQLSLHQDRLESLNHNMVPAISEWVNRYLMLVECQQQLDSYNSGSMVIVAPFGENIGLTDEDLKVETELTTDIGLVGRLIEKARVLACRGVAVPSNPSRLLEQSVDQLLRRNGSSSLLLDVVGPQRIHGASMIYNALESMLGSDEIQKALDDNRPLLLPETERDDFNQFATAVITAAAYEKLSLQGIVSVAMRSNLIADNKKA